MSNTGLKISLDQDAYEALIATRMVYCAAFKCKHHDLTSAQCIRKKIEIKEDGRCVEYDPGGAG